MSHATWTHCLCLADHHLWGLQSLYVDYFSWYILIDWHINKMLQSLELLSHSENILKTPSYMRSKKSHFSLWMEIGLTLNYEFALLVASIPRWGCHWSIFVFCTILAGVSNSARINYRMAYSYRKYDGIFHVNSPILAEGTPWVNLHPKVSEVDHATLLLLKHRGDSL